MLSATIANTKIVDVENIEDGWMILDIGPKTRELLCRSIGANEDYYFGMVLWRI